MLFEVEFPQNVDVFYWDYTIQPTKKEGINAIFAIFEHDSRVTNKIAGYTPKTNADWRTFDIQETNKDGKRFLMLTI